MKTFVTILLAMFLAFVQQASAQASKTLVKSIDPKGAMTLAVNIPGQITIKETDSEFIRVATHVEITNFNASILDRLIEAGRYSVQVTTDNEGNCVLSLASLNKKVIIKDVTLNEVLSFEIELPKGMRMKSNLSANANINETF